MAGSSILLRRIAALEKRIENLKILLKKQGMEPEGIERDMMTAKINDIAERSREKVRLLKKERRRCRIHARQSLENLPFDLKLHIMRHTREKDLNNLTSTSAAFRIPYILYEKAIFRGMEDEQFSELKSLFGDSRHRSPGQKQALKDCLALTFSGPWAELEQKLEMVDKDNLSTRENICVLQQVLDYVKEDASILQVSRRTAMCITMFKSPRVWSYEVEEKEPDQSWGPTVHKYHIFLDAKPMEERIALFERQPPAIQAEIRSTLKQEILLLIGALNQGEHAEFGEVFAPIMGPQVAVWIECYFGPDKVDWKMEKDQMKPWIAKLAIGHILAVMLQYLGNCPKWVAQLIRAEDTWFADALRLELENSGSTDGFWKEERGFIERIGFDWTCVLKDTAVERYLASNEYNAANGGSPWTDKP